MINKLFTIIYNYLHRPAGIYVSLTLQFDLETDSCFLLEVTHPDSTVHIRVLSLSHQPAGRELVI